MRIVAMLARSDGNESVGDMWTETATFPETATLATVMEWASAKRSGHDWHRCTYVNVKLSIDQSDMPVKDPADIPF